MGRNALAARVAALPLESIWTRITLMLHAEPAAPLPEDARDWFEGD